MRLLFFTFWQLLYGISTLTLSLQVEPEKPLDIPVTAVIHNETIPESFEIKALFDYESGLVFYKDNSISACLVERIPEQILESSGLSTLPTFKIPIPSEEVCIGRDNDLLKTEKALISEPGLLFCSGLPILDINKFTTIDTKPSHRQTHQNQFVRRKRQSNGYYRTSAPTGEARAQSNWNSGQASQAQVQGQVFGSGFFSGQAQSQQTGMSQSQVQLSGVGIRGQIASSSGNAQTQLSLGSGAGSGQASGLGMGPSNSQVQVTLGQQGEESMASASATSDGSRAAIGGTPGTGAFGSLPIGNGRQHAGVGNNGGARPEGPGYGFQPGTKLFDDPAYPSFSRPNGGGVGHNYGQTPGYANQIGNGYLGRGQAHSPPGGLNNLHQGLSGVGGIPSSGAGVGDTRYPSNGLPLRNGQIGGGYRTVPGYGQVPVLGSDTGSRHGVGTEGIPGVISGQSIPGNVYGQDTGGSRLGTQPGSNVYGLTPDTSGVYGQGPSSGTGLLTQGGHNGNNRAPSNSHGPFQGQPGQIDSGSHLSGAQFPGHGTRVVDGNTGGNGQYRIPSHAVDGSLPLHGGDGGHAGGTGGYRIRGSESNGRPYYTGSVAGRPHAQSSTPGAYASTYGLGQAQAQTVYFGNMGNGQYTPLRYDQSSQPGGPPGIQRFQDQQVGVGHAGQRQQNGGGNGIGGPGSGITGIGTHNGNGKISNGHRQNGVHSGYGNAVAPQTPGQQPVRNGVGLSSNGLGQSQPDIRTGSGVHTSVPGSSGDTSGYVSNQTPLGGQSAGVPGSQNYAGYTNGHGRGQGQPQTHTSLPGYLPAAPGYQNGHRQTATAATTNGGNDQAHIVNGQTRITNGHTNHHQIPSTARNGHGQRVNGNIGNGQSSQIVGQYPGQTSVPGGYASTTTGDGSQDGFSPSYGISRPSQDDPEGRKCTIITFSCTIVVESNGRAKICRPNAVKVNGNGNGANGGNGAGNSQICCC